jgi:hypothetical protein
MRRKFGLIGAGIAVAATMLLSAGNAAAENDPAKIVGPNACAECHKLSAEVWKGTHHFSTFTDLPRADKARTIADKMGVRRIKNESLCTTCHFTNQKEGEKVDAVAGISCESCHGAGADWIKVHSSFSGKKKETESPAEAKERWAKSEAAGMIRPSNLYALASNCFSCHVVPQEKLVNDGGHPAGSAFELVAWSQGEVRHTLWYSEGNQNLVASPERQRMMFVVGTAVELETALRAVGKATERKDYAVAMAQRAAAVRARADELAKALPKVPELAEIAAAAAAAGLKLNNEAELSAAADKIAAAAKKLAAGYDGKAFAAIDAMLPKPDQYKGKPAR